MKDERIEPHKVTKPIQLLAAWLVGLCLISGSFLATAVVFKEIAWASAILIVAAIVNVPVFLYALFLLQTKYRPEMQEDSYYATYLEKNTNREIEVIKPVLRDPRIEELREQLVLLNSQVKQIGTPQERSADASTEQSGTTDWRGCRIALNDYYPEFWAIRKEFKAANIPIASIFGSVNNSGPLQKWVIAVDVEATAPQLQLALKHLMKFPFDGVKLTKREPEEDLPEHIYVGSYALGQGYAPINDQFYELVNNGIDPIDFAYYVSKNLIKV